MPRIYTRKVSDVDILNAVTAHFCGVEKNAIMSRYGISASSLQSYSIGAYAKRDSKSLENFYRQHGRKNSESNAIDLYIRKNGCKSDYGFIKTNKFKKGRFNSELYDNAFLLVKKNVIGKKIREIVNDTGWTNVLKTESPYSALLSKAFKETQHPFCIEELFDLNLSTQYDGYGSVSLDSITEETKQQVTEELLKNGFGFNASAEEKVKEALTTLTKRELEVLDAKFNLSGSYDKRLTYAQIGPLIKVTPERIRQIQDKGFRKLRHPVRKNKLEPFYNFSLERVQEIKDRIDASNAEVYESIERSKYILPNGDYLEMKVSDLDLSVRAQNCLNNAGITTVAELAQKRESELLKSRNFGRGSFKEIKGKLDELGLNFEGRRYISPDRDYQEIKIIELGLSVRAYNCLNNCDITTVGELVQKREKELLQSRNFGRGTLKEIKEELGRLNLCLKS